MGSDSLFQAKLLGQKWLAWLEKSPDCTCKNVLESWIVSLSKPFLFGNKVSSKCTFEERTKMNNTGKRNKAKRRAAATKLQLGQEGYGDAQPPPPPGQLIPLFKRILKHIFEHSKSFQKHDEAQITKYERHTYVGESRSHKTL